MFRAPACASRAAYKGGLIAQGASDRNLRCEGDGLRYLSNMTQHDQTIHRYTEPVSSKDVTLCVECAAKQHPPLLRQEVSPLVCRDCKKRYMGVWLRWQSLLAQQSSPDAPLPSIDILGTFVADAKITFNSIGLEEGHIKTYVVLQGTRRIAFPCLRHDLVKERTRISQWRPALAACKWFMPTFITGAELEKWSTLLWCPDNEREATFEELMHEMYTPRRQVRSVCTFHDREEFKPFRNAIIDALKAAHLGLYHASTPTLLAVVEGVLRAMEATLRLPPVRNEVRVLIENVFDGSLKKIRAYRGLGINPIHWIPEEYGTLEFLARLDHIFLSLLLFKDFLLTQLFARTEDVDIANPKIINRHAILHGLTPPRGIALDTVKLIGVLDGFAGIIGYITEQGFALYGALDGAHDASGGIVHEPGSSIDVVADLLGMLQDTRNGPDWTTVDGRASRILDAIATNGTVILPR